MKLFDGFFRGHADPREIEPLYVFKHVSPDGNTALFSRNNRPQWVLQAMGCGHCTLLQHHLGTTIFGTRCWIYPKRNV